MRNVCICVCVLVQYGVSIDSKAVCAPPYMAILVLGKWLRWGIFLFLVENGASTHSEALHALLLECVDLDSDTRSGL